MDFSLSLEHIDFNGPLDVLFDLIERKKLPVSDISIVSIVDEYLFFLKENADRIPKQDIAAFIVIASALIYAKSVFLLPKAEKKEESDTVIENILERLELHGLMKGISHALFKDISIKKKKITLNQEIIKKQFNLKVRHYTSETFETLLDDVLKRKRESIEEGKIIPLQEIRIPITVTLDDIMKFWEKEFENEMIKKSKEPLSFQSQFKKLLNHFDIVHNKEHIIIYKKNLSAHFLSILELARNHEYTVTQETYLSDIFISK